MPHIANTTISIVSELEEIPNSELHLKNPDRIRFARRARFIGICRRIAEIKALRDHDHILGKISEDSTLLDLDEDSEVQNVVVQARMNVRRLKRQLESARIGGDVAGPQMGRRHDTNDAEIYP